MSRNQPWSNGSAQLAQSLIYRLREQSDCAKLSAAMRTSIGKKSRPLEKDTMLKGSLVAIVSPMLEDGSLDLDALRRLIDWHIAEGTDGIVVVGTTGESPTVDFEEHCQLIRTAVLHTAGRVPVIAGTGANSTSE